MKTSAYFQATKKTFSEVGLLFASVLAFGYAISSPDDVAVRLSGLLILLSIYLIADILKLVKSPTYRDPLSWLLDKYWFFSLVALFEITVWVFMHRQGWTGMIALGGAVVLVFLNTLLNRHLKISVDAKAG